MELYLPSYHVMSFACSLIFVFGLAAPFYFFIMIWGVFQREHKVVQNGKYSFQGNSQPEKYYDALINNNFFPVIVIDSRGDLVELSPAALKLLGITRDDLPKRLNDYLQDISFQDVWDILREKQEYQGEKLIKSSDGEENYVEIFLAHLKDDLYIGIMNNITERKNKEKIKDEFISAVSHELRNPLAMMRANTDILYSSIEKKLKDNNSSNAAEGDLDINLQKDLERLRAVNNYIEQMSSIINHLLDVTRFDLGKVQLNKQKFNLLELLKSLADDMALINKSHNITLQNGEREEHPHLLVEADPARIKDVINNLISNAIKYSPEGTDVRISWEEKGDKAVISVSDEGVGIAPQDKEKIFQRFYMSQKKDAEKKQGLGLGLYICKRLIELHGGEIWCESQEGKGSTFYFSLPLIDFS